MTATPHRTKLLTVFGCAALAVFLAAVGVQGYGEAMKTARRMSSQNNLKNIVLALHYYEEEHKVFPFAGTIADQDGEATCSWRVAVLPYLDRKSLFDAYDFDQPWDSRENWNLVKDVKLFRSPLDTKAPRTNTSYVVIRGRETMFPAREHKSFGDLSYDGISNTIAVVEILNSGIHWAEPRDLIVDDLDFTIRQLKDAKPGQLSGAHAEGMLVGWFDGRVSIVKFTTDPELVKKMIKLGDKAFTICDGD